MVKRYFLSTRDIVRVICLECLLDWIFGQNDGFYTNKGMVFKMDAKEQKWYGQKVDGIDPQYRDYVKRECYGRSLWILGVHRLKQL